jgi:DNA (cytosine-5)-methyltransferase 1
VADLVLSLFPGIGLLDRAFEEEGFCVVRGPDVLWGGDIHDFHPPAGRFEGVIGGPPCQTFSSLANLVRAKGLEPRFGNLIPEFERVVALAASAWFLMENVPAAPEPVVAGYRMTSFMLNNCHLDAGDGYGEEQERKRRFSFGLRGLRPAPNLRDRWIRPAALLLPRAGTVSHTHIDNSPDAKRRTASVVGYDVRAWPRRGAERTPTVRGTPRIREQCALDGRSVPVAHGGTKGKRKRTHAVVAREGGEYRARQVAHSGAAARPNGGHLIVYRWARMLELQGLPPDFLEHAPFTVEGKRKAVANGVPLQMGRAIARAVRAALREA